MDFSVAHRTSLESFSFYSIILQGMPMENTKEALEIVRMEDIVKVFPGVTALDHVDFHLKPGEIRGLLGKNGAGKSTLINILTGIYPKDGGTIIFNEEVIGNMTSTSARQLGISCVHQHSQLIAPLSIAENIFCGDLPTNRFGIVDWGEVNHLAKEYLLELGLDIDVTQKVEGLSVAERQILEIAKALFADAKVIVLDEATAPLPKNEVNMLFDFVRKQRDSGVAFIYISHFLEEVSELCDTVTILRDGIKIGDYQVADIDQNELIRLISGTTVDRFEHEKRILNTPVVLNVENLNRESQYYDINLSLKQGEIVGLTGLEGCGKDTFARGLFGLEPVGKGIIELNGAKYSVSDPREALNKGVAYLPRDRHGYGIIGLRPVSENISISILRRMMNAMGLLQHKKERKLVVDMIDKLNIVASSMKQPVQFLSGGNQQKTVFAKLASVHPKLLLLDEPTQGVDVQAKCEILRIVDQLAQEGAAVVVISEEIRELLDICDRILVMYSGRIVKEFDAKEKTTTVQNVLSAVEGSGLQ
jgi:ABC-type sugar transport system ATPase subunit